MRIPNFNDVKKAAQKLDGRLSPTPLVQSDIINEKIGKTVWFKPECNQKVGAFKYRGAYNRLSALSADERAAGVVAFSSGNHAQGVSRSAKELGISAIIVMPSDAPQIKIEGVRNDGAEIVFYDRLVDSREDITLMISKRDGRIIVPSFDDPWIIAGQGTVGLEVVQECAKRNITCEAVVTPLGGGGLCAGISLALSSLSPATKIYGAEPVDYNDHQLSLKAGKRIKIASETPTVCDAIMTPQPGTLTFEINRQALSDVYVASDEDCLWAMGLIYEELGLTVEPGGVVGLAALLKGRANEIEAETIIVILSGGNVDPMRFRQAQNFYKQDIDRQDLYRSI